MFVFFLYMLRLAFRLVSMSVKIAIVLADRTAKKLKPALIGVLSTITAIRFFLKVLTWVVSIIYLILLIFAFILLIIVAIVALGLLEPAKEVSKTAMIMFGGIV